MSKLKYHISQANIALGRALLNDPIMQDFVNQLEYINSVADKSQGFIWRLQTEDGDATSAEVLDNPLIIFNMSVWESIENLYDYVYHSDHLSPLKSRKEWFEKMNRPHSVLWWIPAGSIPDIADGEHRLNLIHDKGPSPEAFTFTQLFDPQGIPIQNRLGRNWEWA